MSYLIVNPHIKVSECTYLWKLLDEWYKKIAAEILKNLSSDMKILLALDIWTSSTNVHFLAIVTYFILNDWEYMKVLLSFASCENQSDVDQTVIVKHIIMIYDVADHLNTITFNNASYNETLHSALTEVLAADDIIWNFSVMHVSCMTHVVQLLAVDLMKQLKSVSLNNNEIETFNMNDELKRLNSIIIFENTVKKIWWW